MKEVCDVVNDSIPEARYSDTELFVVFFLCSLATLYCTQLLHMQVLMGNRVFYCFLLEKTDHGSL